MIVKYLFITVLFFNCLLFSQLPCPLVFGTITTPKRSFFNVPDETLYTIKSENQKVVCLSEGIVSNILYHSDNTKTLIIRNNDDFYVYSNLDVILFKSKDKIEKNQLIGYAIRDKDDEKYVLQFQFWKKTESIKADLNCAKSY
ncbi:MAG: peptidoglycan DD-metalloendopeptidase family protein [Chryseobacterium sp.]|uniref:M23 family metallopeptidase n=1 Tax=Chryseobacterium sp. TaxID=1871047 RepID=UPI001B1F6D6B|nr:M23 family metallopeptidase [Chryseobacterium sp.]MBO6184624.1 peptidoglycan DD-metalloendopeptidase family protein [Chryseobacterium sp.]